MSFHPNDVNRRGRAARVLVVLTIFLLVSAFFRTQVLRNNEFLLQSEGNRFREVPIPAPRGTIYDRNGRVIAENVPGYTVSLLAPNVDSLRAAMRRLGGTITITDEMINMAVRRFRRAPNRPTAIIPDATFDVVSVLEEHRAEFPGLDIRATPKRYYPDSTAVAAFVGYTGELNEAELEKRKAEGYKAGQQIGKGGLELQYEVQLRGIEGVKYVEVDARGRVVREAGARSDSAAVAGKPLQTTIDLALQKYVVDSVFADSLMGSAVVLTPEGEVVVLASVPGFDPNRFIGGIPADYWKQLQEDPRRPLYNKALQGVYEPGSTFKLATSVMGMAEGVMKPEDRMPTPCSGGYQFGSRYFRCWDRNGHGSTTLVTAIKHSCDVYYYQLGLKLGLSRIVAGGVDLGFRERTGIDLPNEQRSRYPNKPAQDYYNRLYGARNWTQAVILNLAIGQGENAQTVINMARFYAALATDGQLTRPHLVKHAPERRRVFQLDDHQFGALVEGLKEVLRPGGTAALSAIPGIEWAGKTGTAQNPRDPTKDHAWFAGFAPADKPRYVIVVFLEFGEHGSRAARIASTIMKRALGINPNAVAGLKAAGPEE
ncbi:MAG: penicillin-binding protein 2 [Gemmatimonadaceae bacterium]